MVSADGKGLNGLAEVSGNRLPPEAWLDISVNRARVANRVIKDQMAMMLLHLTMAPNGRLVIPAGMRAELGVRHGGKLVARTENGAVILEPIDSAIRRARAMVRSYVPEGASLADEVIAERHAAAEDE